MSVLTRRKLLSWCVLVACGVAAAACVPSTYIPDRMPMLVTTDGQGSLTITFPLCEGQAVAHVGITGVGADGESWTLRQGDARARVSRDEVVSLTFDDETLSAGKVSDRWPVEVALAPEAPRALGAYDHVFARTSNYSAGLYLADVAGAGTWIIDGDVIWHDAVLEPVSPADGRDDVQHFCDER